MIHLGQTRIGKIGREGEAIGRGHLGESGADGRQLPPGPGHTLYFFVIPISCDSYKMLTPPVFSVG